MNLLLIIESVLPRRFSQRLQERLGYGGESNEARKKAGFLVSYPFFTGIVTLIISLIVFGTTPIIMILGYLSGLLLCAAALYLFIDYQSMVRSRKIEERLPDALELISVNLNSGLTIEQALIDSARPEFGELAFALKRAAKEIFSGETVEKSFKEVSRRIDSTVVERTVLLITEGMKKGASLGNLLLRIARDLRSEGAIKREINSNISMYIALIIIATAVAGPILFGAGSVVALAFSEKNQGIAINPPEGTNSHIFAIYNKAGATNSKFTHDEINIIANICLIFTCLFASMMIGIIRYNKETAGARYFFVLFIISLVIYWGTHTILQKLILGTM